MTPVTTLSRWWKWWWWRWGSSWWWKEERRHCRDEIRGWSSNFNMMTAFRRTLNPKPMVMCGSSHLRASTKLFDSLADHQRRNLELTTMSTISVFVSVCIHIFMHACIHASIHIYIHAHMHVCMHACIHTYTTGPLNPKPYNPKCTGRGAPGQIPADTTAGTFASSSSGQSLQLRGGILEGPW